MFSLRDIKDLAARDIKRPLDIFLQDLSIFSL